MQESNSQATAPVSATSDDGWTVASASLNGPTQAELQAQVNAAVAPAAAAAATENVVSDAAAETTVPPGADATADTATEPVADVDASATPASQTPAEPAPPAPPKERPRVKRGDPQSKIDALTWDKREGERRLAAQQAETDRLRSELEASRRPSVPKEPVAQTAPTPPPAAVPATPRPTWKQFEEQGKSFDEYETALTDWIRADAMSVARSVVDQQITETQKRARDHAAELNERARMTAFQSRMDAARKENPDIDTILNGGIGLTKPMMDAVVDSETPAVLLLHLTEHPEEVQRLSALHPIIVWREMGKLEGRLTSQAAAPTSGPASAPPVSRVKPPTRPVAGSPSAVATPTPDLDNLDFGPDYVRLQNEQDQARRRARL